MINMSNCYIINIISYTLFNVPGREYMGYYTYGESDEWPVYRKK